jgi:hypothetical protein
MPRGDTLAKYACAAPEDVWAGMNIRPICKEL